METNWVRNLLLNKKEKKKEKNGYYIKRLTTSLNKGLVCLFVRLFASFARKAFT